ITSSKLATPVPSSVARGELEEHLGRSNIMEEAESFLDALKGEVLPTEILTEGLTRSPEEIEEEMDVETPAANLTGQTNGRFETHHSRRESQIWEGSFVESPRKSIRSRTLSKEVDDPSVLEKMQLDRDELGPASLVPIKSSPGLWVVERGRTFNVSQEMADAAKSWYEGPKDLTSATHLKISLCCYPADAFPTSKNFDTTDSHILGDAQSLEAAWSFTTCLCIEIGDRVWSPFDLSSQTGPIDISTSIKMGKNEIRVIQLTDLSKLTFVVCASHPSASELDRAKKKQHFQQLVRLRVFLRPKLSPLTTPVAS
ncbi:hypothetical protein DFH11DRAFT_1606878, partial [Phellopilus nigrolimitatus]